MRGRIVATRDGGVVEAQSLQIWIVDRANGGATVAQRFPGFLRVGAERRDCSDSCDCDAKLGHQFAALMRRSCGGGRSSGLECANAVNNFVNVTD